jgi:hypothetical protein
MHVSRGGGMCDCGDREAWKREPCCTIHEVSEQAMVREINKVGMRMFVCLSRIKVGRQ